MEQDHIIDDYYAFLEEKAYPCVGAKTAVTKQQLKCMVAGHMACPNDDLDILQFLYSFVEEYRNSTLLFHSATVIFKSPESHNEEMFESLLWQRLQALADLDAENYSYDRRVSNDPVNSFFSFSLKEEAFFILGLHPASSRTARQFKYPALVFNPHAQFEALRETDRYERLKNIIRKRDEEYSGSVNPMLEDFGESSEVYQYSGRKYDKQWQCPFKPNHGSDKYNS
ncbi:MAG: YqcI/YcgG family protein [Bacteroidota bacterium]|nr:YqcI/YcgG family protein [Bacteroidota bacterium]